MYMGAIKICDTTGYYCGCSLPVAFIKRNQIEVVPSVVGQSDGFS